MIQVQRQQQKTGESVEVKSGEATVDEAVVGLRVVGPSVDRDLVNGLAEGVNEAWAELNQLDEQDAVAALRAFLAVEQKDAPWASEIGGNLHCFQRLGEGRVEILHGMAQKIQALCGGEDEWVAACCYDAMWAAGPVGEAALIEAAKTNFIAMTQLKYLVDAEMAEVPTAAARPEAKKVLEGYAELRRSYLLAEGLKIAGKLDAKNADATRLLEIQNWIYGAGGWECQDAGLAPHLVLHAMLDNPSDENMRRNGIGVVALGAMAVALDDEDDHTNRDLGAGYTKVLERLRATPDFEKEVRRAVNSENPAHRAMGVAALGVNPSEQSLRLLVATLEDPPSALGAATVLHRFGVQAAPLLEDLASQKHDGRGLARHTRSAAIKGLGMLGMSGADALAKMMAERRYEVADLRDIHSAFRSAISGAEVGDLERVDRWRYATSREIRSAAEDVYARLEQQNNSGN